MKLQVTKFMLALVVCCLLAVNVFSYGYSSALTSISSSQEINAAINAGFDYLSTQINEDGGIRWIDDSSSAAATIKVVLALASHHFTQDHLTSPSGNHPIDYLEDHGIDWINQQDSSTPGFSPARAGQLLMAIAAANKNPKSFGSSSIDLVYELKSIYDPNSGTFGAASSENVLDQTWSILGLAANHAGVPDEASLWLSETQLENGSWDDGYGSFLDTTPLAIMALIASGWPADSQEVTSAFDYLRANQQSNGGWQSQWDSTTNPDTTGVILQSLVSFGQNPLGENWQVENSNPITALLSIQQETGAFGTDYANAYSTADALLGLSGQPFYQLGLLKSISTGFEYLINAQDESGGWGSPGQTIDAMLAFWAGGWRPNSINVDDNSPDDFLNQNLSEYLRVGPDAVGKTIIAAVMTGDNPEQFHGVDLIQTLLDDYNTDLGTFGDPENSWHQAFAILGLKSAQTEIPDGAINTLLQLQQEDGSWAYSPGIVPSPDTTSLAIQALLAGGMNQSDQSVQKGLEYIRSEQLEDGGWGDSSTTSYVLMVINALGQSSDEWKTGKDHSPLTALLAFQNPNGAFYFSKEYSEDSIMSTTTTLIALSGGSYLIEKSPQTEEKKAGLLVIPDSGEINATCVTFEDSSISGQELLDRSGLAYETQDGFMNTILGIGNPDGGTLYWSYWHWNGREWIFSTTGAGESEVFTGSIEAWYLTSWEQFPSLPPKAIPDLTQICGREIPKNYAVQPYLNYSELKIFNPTSNALDSIVKTPTASAQPPEITSTPTIKEVVTQEVLVGDENQAVRSIIPIVIISAVGIMLVIIIIVFLRKQK